MYAHFVKGVCVFAANVYFRLRIRYFFIRSHSDSEQSVVPVFGRRRHRRVHRRVALPLAGRCRRDRYNHVPGGRRIATPPRHRSLPLAGLDYSVSETGIEFAMSLPPAQRLPESVSILHGHQIVQYRVYGGRKVVQTSGDVIQPLVYLLVMIRLFGVHVQQSLRVERRPAKEERYHNSNWKT